jgi:hypothetical protein
MLKLYDHPFSPYAQKVKIALREKGQAFEALMPQGIGSGGAAGEGLARGGAPWGWSATPEAMVGAGKGADFDRTGPVGRSAPPVSGPEFA